MSWEMHEAAKKIADGWYSELKATRKENAVLVRENAKLRDELENARMRGDDLASSISEWRAVTEARGQTIDRLAAENAKLRELVRDVYALNWSGADCTECPDGFISRCDSDGCSWLGILADRMRELGVEV